MKRRGNKLYSNHLRAFGKGREPSIAVESQPAEEDLDFCVRGGASTAQDMAEIPGMFAVDAVNPCQMKLIRLMTRYVCHEYATKRELIKGEGGGFHSVVALPHHAFRAACFRPGHIPPRLIPSHQRA